MELKKKNIICSIDNETIMQKFQNKKIQKGNCKILCLCVCMWFFYFILFLFLWPIYEVLFLLNFV